ncbi:DEAD/DEAH box helicase family protein [Salinimicrobium terrae]|uniref:DEAD/DEAH box helicase family protein n=1 Tax=Salinimicrobium terrae TaxID=470866 RepID=UPI000415066C|nr:DEAD/DEAH box helicase family protein [Salinimicrobium terrae]
MSLKKDQDQTKEIFIKQYISEEKENILSFIDLSRRVLLNASPGSGKTKFFADLCISQVQNKKEGRIIYCSPFLIIQNQFKNELLKKGIAIDLELNHQSRRKSLNSEDQIVTSTYHSLKLIGDGLTSKDIIILDEAHSLLYNYKKEYVRQFFFSTFQVLIKTSAKIVAMSGTPYEAIKYILGLNELKIIKRNKKAQINIQYSKDSAANHVKRFAEECLERFPQDHLNIIYIKNKKECEKFKHLIESNFNCKAFVLTASRKDSEIYESLVIDSNIPSGIQFLITTNVISTGANVLNEKIGKALMLHEHNPVEIKQFSKRFRKKMDIEVDVVNRQYQKAEFSVKAKREEINLERNHQRLYFNMVLPYLIDSHNRFEYLFAQKSSFYYKDSDGSPSHLLDSLIKKMVIQEAYFIEELNQTYNDPDELEIALQEFDDVFPVHIPNKYDFEFSGSLDEEREIEFLLKMKFEEVIDHSIQNYKILLFNLFAYSERNTYIQTKIKTLLKGEFNANSVPKEIAPKYGILFKETDFIDSIFKDLIQINSEVRNVAKSLYFLKTTAKNKRKSTLISFHVNELLHQYFEIKFFPSSYHPELIYKKELNMELLEQDKGMNFKVNLIRFCYKYCIRQEYINIEKLQAYLKDYFSQHVKIFKDPILSEINVNSNGKIIDYPSNLVIGIIKGLFYMKEKPQERKKGDGKISSYLFESQLPNSKNATTIKEESDIIKANNDSIILHYSGLTMTYEKIKFKNLKKRYLNSHALLSYSLVDKGFYSLLEKKTD